MSLTTDLKYITQPNRDLIKWLESIENKSRRREIVHNNAIREWKRGGLNKEQIVKYFVQLASHTSVPIIRLTNEELAAHLCVGAKGTSAVCEDEDDKSVSSMGSEGRILVEAKGTSAVCEDEDDNSVSSMGSEGRILVGAKGTSAVCEDEDDNSVSSMGSEGRILVEAKGTSSVCEDEDDDSVSRSEGGGSETARESVQTVARETVQTVARETVQTLGNNRVKLPNELNDNVDNNVDSAVLEKLLEKAQVEAQAVNSDKCQNTHSSNKPESLSITLGNNLGKSVLVIDNVQADQTRGIEKTSNQENTGIQSKNVISVEDKLKVKTKNRESEKLRFRKKLENYNNNDRCTITANKTIKVADTNANTNSIGNKNAEICKKSNNRRLNNSKLIKNHPTDKLCTDEFSNKQLFVNSSTVNNKDATSLNDSAKLKGTNESMLNNNEVRTSNKRPLLTKEDITSMKILKEKLDKKLSMNNVVDLPSASSLQSLSRGHNDVSVQCTSKENQTNPNSPGTSNKRKHKRKKEEKTSKESAMYNELKNSMDEFKNNLIDVQNAISKKRLSLDSRNNHKHSKKRRFSVPCHGNETEKEIDCSETKTRVSSNKAQVPQHGTIQRSGNHPTKSNLSQVTLNTKKKHSPTGTLNQSITEKPIAVDPSLTSNNTLSKVVVGSNNQQPSIISDAKSYSIYATSQIVLAEGCTTPSTKPANPRQKTGGKSLNKPSSNLLMRHSDTRLESQLSPDNLQATEPNLKSPPNVTTCTSLNKNSNTPGHPLPRSEVDVNNDRSGVFEICENRLEPEPLIAPTNNQNLTNQHTTEATKAQATSKHPTTGPNRIIEEALHRFSSLFCNQSGNIIPEQFHLSLNAYFVNHRLTLPNKLSELLKLYIACYLKLFNSEDFSNKICKTAELLHLSIADFNRRNERLEKANRLQSETLRKGEIQGAHKDYEEILNCRGKQFSDIFTSVLSTFKQLNGCEFVLLVTFYFKLTQALVKIDAENNKYFFTLRHLMKSLLTASNPNFLADQQLFFRISVNDFESNCRFVKQCLLTLYMAGHHDTGTETFWELVKYTPVISNLDKIMAELKNRTPAAKSSNDLLGGLREQSLLASLNRSHLQANAKGQQASPQNQIDRIPQTPGMTYSTHCSNQSNQSGNTQTTMVGQKAQPFQHPPIAYNQSLLSGIRPPSRLPPFASFNHPQQLVQQRNVPVLDSFRMQGNQQPVPVRQPVVNISHPVGNQQPVPVRQPVVNISHPVGHQQPIPVLGQPVVNIPHPVPMTATQQPQPHPQLVQQSIRVASRQFLFPPPAYPGRGAAAQQNWRPRGGGFNNISPNTRPQNNHQSMLQNTMQNPPNAEMPHALRDKCSTAGCSKLATVVCSNCRSAVYCNTDCQFKDWYSNHSKICFTQTRN